MFVESVTVAVVASWCVAHAGSVWRRLRMLEEQCVERMRERRWAVVLFCFDHIVEMTACVGV